MRLETGDDTGPLEGGTALVTGGGMRIGEAIVRELHGAGMRVWIHYYRSREAALALARELEARRPGSTATVAGDLADPGVPERIITTLAGEGLDLLVNNASLFRPAPLEAIDLAEWEAVMGVNLRAPLLLARAAAPLLRQRGGCIVNLTDVHAARPLKDYPLYSTSKAALEMLTRALARELAPEVRVNAVAPGAILWPPEMPEALRRTILGRIPLQRTGDPADIAQAVRYLAGAPYVTGQVLRVDGGRSL